MEIKKQKVRYHKPSTTGNSFLDLFKKKNQKNIPFYLKNELPDHRFLEFRLFIHNRKVNEVQHDLGYFESMFNSNYCKKKSKSFSAYKRNGIFTKKKRQYLENFTSGNVSLDEAKLEERSDELRKKFSGLKTKQSSRLNSLVDRALQSKKRKHQEDFNRPSTGIPITNIRSSSQFKKELHNKRLNSS